MNNLLWHLSAFLVAVIMSVVTIFVGQDLLKNTIYENANNQLTEDTFFYKTNYGVNKAAHIAILQHYLSTGRIVVFGSSELTADHQKYIPYNFFKRLDIHLTAFGHAGQQSLAILSQLTAYYNEDMHNNARIVILLSPSWFKSKGTSMQSFIEYMPQKLLETLYFESQVDEEYKLWVSRFLKDNIYKLKQPNSIHYIVASYNPNQHLSTLLQSLPYKIDSLVTGILFGNEYNILEKISPQERYKSVNTNWENWLKDAIEKENNLVTTNDYGINDMYFDQYVKPKIREGKFPFEAGSIAKSQENAEYQDFLRLVKFSKLLKIKPLFVILPLNPYAYEGLENYHDILMEIKHVLESEGFKYLDMWPWEQHDYVKGLLTDVMHVGEVGWVQIDKTIYDYFIGQAR